MRRIYLDHAAATAVNARVLKEMNRVEQHVFANASALYKEGVFARSVVEDARKRIAHEISAHPDEIIFTASGTEANNLALLGLAQDAQATAVSARQSAASESETNSKKNHCIVSAIEHPSVLESVEQLKAYGFSIDLVSVDADGVVDLKELKKLLRPETLFVSVMYANNEIGTIEPIREIMKIVRKLRKENKTQFPYVHTDACQATNYLDMNVLRLGIDLMTFNSPKIYGPKGIAALFKRRGVTITPIIHGGGHEQGLRSGTEDTARIVGFAKALEITEDMKEKEVRRLTQLRDHFIESVKKEIPSAVLNGPVGKSVSSESESTDVSAAQFVSSKSESTAFSAGQYASSESELKRLPNNVNFSFPTSTEDPDERSGKDAEEIVLRLDAAGIAVSTRSACSNKSNSNDGETGSYVVRALGGDANFPLSSVRFTLGRETTKKEIDASVKTLRGIIEKF